MQHCCAVDQASTSPEQALHAIVVAGTCVFLGKAEELLVHAVVEGVPQEVAPEAVQPVHLVRHPWTCTHPRP